MKILLLGSCGMLGKMIFKVLSKEYEVICVDRNEGGEYCFDVTNDSLLRDCICETNPDIVINTIAIVDHDLCEREPGRAYVVNARIPCILANIARIKKFYFIHISTDHFFYGDGDIRHSEVSPVTLVNEYARTKYVGEQLAMTYLDTLILRTNIVGFRNRGKKTFLEWAISEILSKNRMSLFNDFYISSIHTVDFVRILKDLLKLAPVGVYNLAGSYVKSKRDFILGLSQCLFGYVPQYEEKSVKTLAGTVRGDSLGLDTCKIENLLGYTMPSFEDTLVSIKQEYMRLKTHYEI